MRISEGVEWGAHCCILLDWLGPAATVPAVKLAAAFELSPSYLNKQLQFLVKADILESTRGGGGGFSLRRGLARISMYDIVVAIEGDEPAFRCTEIRQCGLGSSSPKSAFKAPCSVASAMRGAEVAWRKSLQAQSLASVQADAERVAPGLADRIRRDFATL